MDIMRHVVQVESSENPYAIGVVGGRLARQPKNLAEAVATAEALESRGYNFSVGLAQVNRYNLRRYGVPSYAQAFDSCTNLRAGASILSECHGRAKGDWGSAFSCYYSGNFVTGYDHGYVQKIFASMRSTQIGVGDAIPLASDRNAQRASGPVASNESSKGARPVPNSTALVKVPSVASLNGVRPSEGGAPSERAAAAQQDAPSTSREVVRLTRNGPVFPDERSRSVATTATQVAGQDAPPPTRDNGSERAAGDGAFVF
jgi:type IV secretion system protein VirB1